MSSYFILCESCRVCRSKSWLGILQEAYTNAPYNSLLHAVRVDVSWIRINGWFTMLSCRNADEDVNISLDVERVKWRATIDRYEQRQIPGSAQPPSLNVYLFDASLLTPHTVFHSSRITLIIPASSLYFPCNKTDPDFLSPPSLPPPTTHFTTHRMSPTTNLPILVYNNKPPHLDPHHSFARPTRPRSPAPRSRPNRPFLPRRRRPNSRSPPACHPSCRVLPFLLFLL